MNQSERVAYTLAAALLIHNGEIALSDIAALPFVEDEETVATIVARLRKNFDTYAAQRRIDGDANSAVEDIIALRTPARLPTSARKSRSAPAISRAADASYRLDPLH